MSKPEISVIMSTWDRETMVGRAIESIIGQTFSDFEFVIINNGSVDRSGELAEEYAINDQRIKVIHREHGNIGSARNAGLDIACGNYIAFVDDDDWCAPDFLEFLYRLAVDNSAEVAICGNTYKSYDEKLIMTAEEALMQLFRRKYYVAQFPTKLIRRSLFENIRFSETAEFDDIEMMPQIIANANVVAYHGVSKYVYNRHEGSVSSWATNHSLLTSEILDEYLSVYRERTEFLSAKFPNNATAWRYFEWSFMISMVDKIVRLEIKGCDSQLAAVKNILREHRKSFYCGHYTQDFEKAWMDEYIDEEF